MIQDTVDSQLSSYFSLIESALKDPDAVSTQSLTQQYFMARKALVQFIRSIHTPEYREKMHAARLRHRIQVMTTALEQEDNFRSKWLDTLVILEAQNTRTLDKTYIDPVASKEVTQERQDLATMTVEQFDSQIQSLCATMDDELNIDDSIKTVTNMTDVHEQSSLDPLVEMNPVTNMVNGDLPLAQPLFGAIDIVHVPSVSSSTSSSVIMLEDDEDATGTPATQSIVNTPGPNTPFTALQAETPGTIGTADVIMMNSTSPISLIEEPSILSPAMKEESLQAINSNASEQAPQSIPGQTTQQVNGSQSTETPAPAQNPNPESQANNVLSLLEEPDDVGLGSGFLDYF